MSKDALPLGLQEWIASVRRQIEATAPVIETPALRLELMKMAAPMVASPKALIAAAELLLSFVTSRPLAEIEAQRDETLAALFADKSPVWPREAS